MKQSRSLLLGITFLVLLPWHALHAQYMLAPVVPPPNFTFNDLWQFTLVRADADNMDRFYVSLRIFNTNSQLKVKSNTAVFDLPVGSHYYNSSNLGSLQPFSTSYYDASVLQQIVASGGLFPPGGYTIVYALYGKAADGDFAPLAEETVFINVEAMWPPMLLLPVDGDSIDTPYPLLTWAPAFSSSVTGAITYTLNMVELMGGQSPGQAITANPMYYTESGQPSTVLLYPAAAPPIDSGKTYVWQVHASSGGQFLGSSEIWTFTRIRPVVQVVQVQKKPFVEISTEGSSYFVEINDGLLRLAFDEMLYDIDNTLTFSIYGQDGQLVADQTRLTRYVREGHNKIRISLCDNSTGFNLPKGYYRIEVLSQRGDTYRLNFYNNKNLTACAEQ